MGINDRISNLIEYLELNPNSFADSLGVKGTVIYNIVKGRRSKPSFDLLQKILLTYRAINASWLLNGEGNLLKETKATAKRNNNQVRIEGHLHELLSQLKAENETHLVAEIKELVETLLSENQMQKEKIAELYKRQDEILSVIRLRLNLDF